MVPLAVPTSNLHTADDYWLVAGDRVTITDAQQYKFSVVDNDDPNNGFTCIFTPGGETCGNAHVAGNPTFSVNVLKCQGQTSECAADMGAVVQTFTFDHLNELNGQQFPVADEDATYSLEPVVDFHSGPPTRGTPTAATKVHVVPRNMNGRVFSATLAYNVAQTTDQWQWPAEGAPWNENFASDLQITDITVQQGGQAVDFCGIKAGARICGCNGNLGATTVCSSVKLRQCSNFGATAVTTPSYILPSGAGTMLGDPNDRLLWNVRFLSCGLTNPDPNASLTITFNLIVR